MLAALLVTAAYSPSAGKMRLPRHAPRDFVGTRHATISVRMLAPVDYKMVAVEEDAEAVAAIVRYQVEAAAEASIAKRGHFALAIPGGSVMKMLAKSGAPAWASKCTLAYVNHKAVPMDDAKLATHAKATALFLDKWAGVDVIVMDGSSDAKAEARSYESKLRTLPESVLPRNAKGLPIFDMMLIGVGDDGHVGSLYPGREEVSDASGRWVLPVEMKVPGSITLSLPVMASAERVVVAACGVSDKSPKGKSEAMQKAIEDQSQTASSFPAVGLRSRAFWVLDAAAGSSLGFDYVDCFAFGGSSQYANVFWDDSGKNEKGVTLVK